MVIPLSSAWRQGILRRQTWLVIFLYILFISSTFSIVGINASVMLLYLAVLYHRYREPVSNPLPRWLWGSFLLLPITVVVSALANGIEAPWTGEGAAPTSLSNLFQMRDLFRLAIPLAILPALARVNLRNLLLTLLASSGLMAVYATVQFRWGVDWLRPEGRKVITPYNATDSIFTGVFHGMGNFSHHLTFAGYMLLLTLLFLGLAKSHAGRMRWIWGAGSLLAAIGVLVSMGRSSWLGVGVGVLLLLLRFPRRMVLPIVSLALLLGMAGAIFSSGWLKDYLSDPSQPALVKRLLSVSPDENVERLYLWESGLVAIQDRPFFGVGHGNNNLFAPEYRKEVSKRRNFAFFVDIATHMHNVYIQLVFEMGIFGLIAYLLWLGAVFHWNRLSLQLAQNQFTFERGLIQGASAGLAGIMAEGFFENSFFDAEVQTMILLLIGLCLHAGLVIRRGPGNAQEAA